MEIPRPIEVIVTVGVGVGVGGTVGVVVGSGVGVGVSTGIAVGVGVSWGVGAAEGTGIAVGVATGSSSVPLTGVGAGVGFGIDVAVEITVGSGVGAGLPVQAFRTTAMARTVRTTSQRILTGDTATSVVSPYVALEMPGATRCSPRTTVARSGHPRLSPQHSTMPSVLTPQVWNLPALTETNPPYADAHLGLVARTGGGGGALLGLGRGQEQAEHGPRQSQSCEGGEQDRESSSSGASHDGPPPCSCGP